MFIFLFPHLFFILLKFQGGKIWLQMELNFQLTMAKLFAFSLKKFVYFCCILRAIFLKKKIKYLLISVRLLCRKIFFCHSGTEMVYSKALKCGIMALSTISVPFALAEGFKPCWQTQRASYSTSSVLLSKLLLSKTINHRPSITIPTIVLDRYP